MKPAKLFIIGHPVSHSLSPKMHEFWMKELGIEGTYEAIDVPPENLETEIKRLQDEGYHGGNVTIPHKEKVKEICTEAGEVATEVGAVNTLIFKEGKIYGHNTDIAGINQSLFGDANIRRILILGAGGAARPVILGCKRVLPKAKIYISNRTAERADHLAYKFDCEVIDWKEKEKFLSRTDLLINTTSLGMRGQPDLEIKIEAMKKDSMVFDIVYVPLKTKLLRQAEKQELKTIDGLWMLIFQGAAAFERWFPGKRISFDLIQKTRKHLLKLL